MPKQTLLDHAILRTFESIEKMLPGLKKRFWATLISPSGSFIGSDNPVIIEGPKGVKQGFENAELISYAVGRHVALWGTLRPIRRQLVSRKFVAKMNTLSMLSADKQVFSHAPDFCWLDENQKVQTDWKLFSKEVISDGCSWPRGRQFSDCAFVYSRPMTAVCTAKWP
jgi:hypothetical protein